MILDANGNGTAFIANMRGPQWDIVQIGIKISNAILIPTCTTYIGTNAAGVYISQTFTGDDDTDSFPNVTIKYGEAICAVWTGGDVGAQARMTVIYNESP